MTAHSVRVGLASELTSRGASTADVMLAGNWKTSRMVVHYSARRAVGHGTISAEVVRAMEWVRPDARGELRELREGLAFLQRRAWAMVLLAVLVVAATWPIPDDTLHKGVVPAGLLSFVSAVCCLRSGYPLPLRRAAVIYAFCYFVFLASRIVRWEFVGW